MVLSHLSNILIINGIFKSQWIWHFLVQIGEYIVMDNMFLVQYEPLTTMTRRVLSLGFEPKPTQEMIEKFYDEVNASDFYHNSIVLVVKAKSMEEVREQVIGTFNVLYGK